MASGYPPDSDGRLIPVRGTRLFVEACGDRSKPALVYLHGGPGTSCHEFMRWQAGLLGRNLRLIAFDQRGVLRSDPVAEDELVTENALVEDCEALRQALGIERWAVLGHSFLGESTLARECRDLSAQPDTLAEGWRVDLLAGLDDRGAYWYLADQRFHQAMKEAAPQRSADDHTGTVAKKLIGDPGFRESLLPALSRLQMPALLIVGKSDLVTSPEQVDAFRRQVPHGQVEVFDHSGHFVQLEQADEYAALVTAFVAQNSDAGF
jgi:proline iminopeptidase